MKKEQTTVHKGPSRNIKDLVTEGLEAQNNCPIPMMITFGSIKRKSDFDNFIVMKRFTGDLFDYMIRNASNLESSNAVNQIMLRLCQRLAKVHTAGVILKDIKPNNIFYDEQEDQFYFGDLGQSCWKFDTDCLKQEAGTESFSPHFTIDEKYICSAAHYDYYSLAVTFVLLSEKESRSYFLNKTVSSEVLLKLIRDSSNFDFDVKQDLIKMLQLPNPSNNTKVEKLDLLESFIKMLKTKVFKKQKEIESSVRLSKFNKNDFMTQLRQIYSKVTP